MDDLKALWAKLGPDVMPEVVTDQRVLLAHKAGDIDEAEFKRLVAAIERRDRKYLRQLGYDDERGVHSMDTNAGTRSMIQE